MDRLEDLEKEVMSEADINKTSEKTTQKSTQKILEIIKNNPSVSRLELAAFLGSMTEDGVKYHLNKMKQQGLIQRIGPDKGGHWEVVEKAKS